MKRIALIAVVASALVLDAQTEQDFINWASQSQQQWAEQSLREYHDAPEIYRAYLWTPFWGQALSRVTVAGDESAELVTKVRDYKQSSSIVVHSRSLSRAEIDGFRALLDQASFWAMPTKIEDHRAKDADVCVLEGVKDGKYHAVRRELSQKSPFVDACSLFTRQALKQVYADQGR